MANYAGRLSLALGILLSLANAAESHADPVDPVCTQPVSVVTASLPCGSLPKSAILGSTLYVDGAIDGMTYDLIMTSPGSGAGLKQVELNSDGGDVDIAEIIAEFIRFRGLKTHVRSGGICASACVLLLQAGVERSAAPNARFLVHGPHDGLGIILKYLDACNITQETCDAFIRQWHASCLSAAQEFFGLMTHYGASDRLFPDYLAQGADDSNWWRRGNGLRIKDWQLDAPTALKYGLLTSIDGA